MGKARQIVRLGALLALVVTVAAGLAARYGLEGAAAKYLGVALWATALFWSTLLVAPRARPRTVFLVTWALAWTVELLQLTPLPAWLSSRHLLLRLVLGTTFHAWDLLCYVAGALLALGCLLVRRRTGW